MIRDAQAANEEISPNSFEIGVLRDALPQYFDADGNFQLEKFQTMLKEQEVELSRESYELNFLGKSYARLLASLETETVLVPNGEHNSIERNADSENIYITGDNLDALKHLSKSYRGKIKCIYIDPPYNTGKKDFSYADTYSFSAQELVDQIGVTEQEAQRILDLQGSSSHSAWLTFMLPRLVLGRELLTSDGTIFVSIDENEHSNLRLLCDEIFGEENFLADFTWKNKAGGGNDSAYVAIESEFILGYARNINHLDALFTGYTGDYLKRYKEEDEYGKYFWDTFKRKSAKQYYPITTPDGTVLEFDESGARISWLRSEATFKKDLERGEVKFVDKGDGEWSIMFKQRLPKGKKPRSILDKVGTTSDGGSAVIDLFGREVFSNPKPPQLIEHLISFGADADSIIIDFFAGSGTTAQAVMNLNSQDNGHRRFICVQEDYVIDPNVNEQSKNAVDLGFSNLEQLSRKRIGLAADQIAQETGANIDYGFKHYTLTTPEQAEIDRLESFTTDPSLFKIDPLERFTFENAPAKQVMLTTWAVHDGYGLTPDSRQVTLDGYVPDVIGSTAYIIDSGFTSKDMIVLIRLIESNELQINHVVYFNTALPFEVLTELKQALRNISTNGSINIEARW